MHQQLISEPFVTLGAENQFDVVARITGGGVTGQAGALRLGIARALILVDPENRPTLKRAGFLTRDATGQGAQEVRAEEGAQGTSVLQALTSQPGFPVNPPQRSVWHVRVDELIPGELPSNGPAVRN